MSRILYRLIPALARLAVRSGRSKDLEIKVRRHQLAVLRRQNPRPKLSGGDRTLLGAIAAALPRPVPFEPAGLSPLTPCSDGFVAESPAIGLNPPGHQDDHQPLSNSEDSSSASPPPASSRSSKPTASTQPPQSMQQYRREFVGDRAEEQV